MRLKGKVAVVTGAGRGLGRMISQIFAREGAMVVVNGRHSEALEKTVETINSSGGQAIVFQGDVGVTSDMDRMFKSAADHFGMVNILINNAGVMVSRTKIMDCEEKDWHQTIETNLTGVYLCSKIALPYLIKSKGNIVNISSIFGLIGGTDRGAYIASKGGVVSLTRGMALDYAPKGVRVNVVCPAYIETEMNRDLLSNLRQKGEFEKILGIHPIGFIGLPEDVAYAALYLASDEARWVTGVALPVDGGMSAGVL
jgi:NAD(P)-dependent dehydrogenase (short-subunit alcohol dehydrogenase family)